MRLLQHSVRNAFVICVLLGFTSSAAFSAVSYKPAFGVAQGGDTVMDYNVNTINYGNSLILDYSIMSCILYDSNASSPQGTSALRYCTDYVDHDFPIHFTCTVNGKPYFPGITERGVTINIKLAYSSAGNARDGNDITESVIAGVGQFVSLSLEAKRAGINNEIGQNSLDVTCEHQFSPLAPGFTAAGFHEVDSFRIVWHLNNIKMIDVSVEQPSPVIGKLMTEFDAPFKMTVENAQPTENLSMTWDVAAPCDSWSPSLRLPDGSMLGIHHADSGRLPSGTSIMTAKFTPTALGAFSCTGTLNVSLD